LAGGGRRRGFPVTTGTRRPSPSRSQIFGAASHQRGGDLGEKGMITLARIDALHTLGVWSGSPRSDRLVKGSQAAAIEPSLFDEVSPVEIPTPTSSISTPSPGTRY